VLQRQVQAEDSEQAMSEVTACHEAQMASVKQGYRAKVANLEHKHDCLMENYIQLMHIHNSKLQEKQQNEVGSLQMHWVYVTCLYTSCSTDGAVLAAFWELPPRMFAKAVHGKMHCL